MSHARQFLKIILWVLQICSWFRHGVSRLVFCLGARRPGQAAGFFVVLGQWVFDLGAVTWEQLGAGDWRGYPSAASGSVAAYA